MWDAAVSELALSPKPIADTSLVKHNFPHALAAVNKVTVLYNQNDTTLAVPYWLAVYFGVDLGDQCKALLEDVAASLINRSPIQHFKADMVETYSNTTINGVNIGQRMQAVFNDPDFDTMMRHWIKAFCSNDDDTVREYMNKVNPILIRYSQQFGCAQALGFVGIKDKKFAAQFKQKVMPADLSKYATGHSYMMIPSEAVMKYGYKTYIMNKFRGVDSFGVYVKANFPDYPLPEASVPTTDKEGTMR